MKFSSIYQAVFDSVKNIIHIDSVPPPTPTWLTFRPVEVRDPAR